MVRRAGFEQASLSASELEDLACLVEAVRGGGSVPPGMEHTWLRAWQLVDRHGFVVLETEPEFRPDARYWTRIRNARQRLNVLPHSDAQKFLLFCDGSRPEATALYPRESALAALRSELGRLTSPPDLVEQLREWEAQIAGILEREGPFPDPDRVAFSVLGLNDSLSTHPGLDDESIFRLSRAIHERAERYEHHWTGRALLLISDRIFHQRLATGAAGVGQSENGLWRLGSGLESSAAPAP